MFPDDNGIKLKIIGKKVDRKSKNFLRLNNTFLNKYQELSR